MSRTLLIHNPRCSKSRNAKEILEKEGVEFEVVDYIKDGLKEKLVAHLPEFTGLKFEELIRKKDDLYLELGLDKKSLSDKEWIEVLMKHPALLERPIFIHKNKAVVARPGELVKTIL